MVFPHHVWSVCRSVAEYYNPGPIVCLGQFHLGSWKVREGNSQRSQLLQKFSFWSFSFSNRNCNLASSFHLIKTKLKSRGRILISLVHVCSSALCTSNIWLLIILSHLKILRPLKHIYPWNTSTITFVLYHQVSDVSIHWIVPGTAGENLHVLKLRRSLIFYGEGIFPVDGDRVDHLGGNELLSNFDLDPLTR